MFAARGVQLVTIRRQFSGRTNPATPSSFFFTDGLTDARNRSDEEFGIEGIQDVCRRHAGESPPIFSAIFSPPFKTSPHTASSGAT
jgi:hypothetical protein